MSALDRFIPRSTLEAKANLRKFVELTQTGRRPLGVELNEFENHAWSIGGLGHKGSATKFIYFAQLGFLPNKHWAGSGLPAVVPDALLLREPFRSYAKALIDHIGNWGKTTSIPARVIALRYVEAALYEMNACTCPTAITPEVMNRAMALAFEGRGYDSAYDICKHLKMSYRLTVELGLVAVPSEWTPSLRAPKGIRNRVGSQFDQERQKKLPSPLALDALAEIFNSSTDDPTAIFASSLCALMLCSPDRAVEVLFAPFDILTPDWTDPDSGEVGTGLRWFPAKGAAPMVKTVIPSMRDIAVRAVDKLRRLSAPARTLALWYDKNPDRIYLPQNLEYLRSRERITSREIHSILYGGETDKTTQIQSNRFINWLDSHHVNRLSTPNGTTVAFAELERAVLADLPEGFPVMDPARKMRYCEALCLVRVSEFASKKNPSQPCFERITYPTLQKALKSSGHNKSLFEKLGYRDADGKFLSLTSHMLRHYLNTLVRQSGTLSEEEIAKWSGRKNMRQNSTYNHESDRDVLAKLRRAVGDPSLSMGPFSNIDNRIFVRREEFASIKIITAHTSEFGHCIHDYAQTPCQVHQDCINCNEQVCVKGDQRAEDNLRKMQVETTLLQEKARGAFSSDVLGAAEWFKHQTKTLERVNELIAILDDPNVAHGAVIQLIGVNPPSRLAMAEEERCRHNKPVSQTTTSIDEVHALLTNGNHQVKGQC